MTTPAQHQQTHAEDDFVGRIVVYAIAAVLVIAALPILLVAVAVYLGVEHAGWRRWRLGLAAAALALVGFGLGAAHSYVATSADAFGHFKDEAFSDFERGRHRARWKANDEPFDAARLWALVPGALAFGPLVGVVGHVIRFHFNESEETRHAREVSAKRRRAKVADKTVARKRTWPTPEGRTVLGVPLDGSLSGWTLRVGTTRYVAPPVGVWGHHGIIVGETGSGKTVTAEAIEGEHLRLRYPVVCIDPKADPATRARFLALCEAHGVEAADGLLRPIDGWRGDRAAVVNRLMATQEFSEPYYESVTRRVLDAAVGEHPPHSFGELLARIEALAHDREWREAGLLGEVRRDKMTELLMGVYGRYDGVARAVGDALDGDWSYEDVDAAYVPVGRPGDRDHAAAVGAFILEDLLHFALSRKPAGLRVLVFVDEFSKLSRHPEAAVEMVERARSFDTSFLLATQTWASMGRDSATRDRIAGTVGTVIVHRLKQPDEVAALAGTEWVMERTEQTVAHWGQNLTGMGSQRPGDRYVVHPNELRRLGRGECFVIYAGHALRMRVRPPIEPGQQPPPSLVVPGRSGLRARLAAARDREAARAREQGRGRLWHP